MEFEYTDCLYVEECDFEEMCSLCKNKGYSPQEALADVSAGWDDYDYYRVGLVANQIIKEIEKRLK